MNGDGVSQVHLDITILLKIRFLENISVIWLGRESDIHGSWCIVIPSAIFSDVYPNFSIGHVFQYFFIRDILWIVYFMPGFVPAHISSINDFVPEYNTIISYRFGHFTLPEFSWIDSFLFCFTPEDLLNLLV